MISWLVRTFVPRYRDVSDPAVRTRYGLLVNVTCIICNIILCLTKGIVGVLAGSVSIVADAVNNLSDASSNIVGLLGFGLASRPADADHPYGHGRYEYLAGLVVSVLVCAIGLNLIINSIGKILHPEPVEFGPAIVIVLVLSMVFKVWMSHFNRRIGSTISSDALCATAVDARNDVITSAAVLISAVVSRFTGIELDGWAGAGVGLFVLWSGVQLVGDAVSPLLGKAPHPEQVCRIRDGILSYPGIIGVHDLLVHDYGPGRAFASAHVEVSVTTNPADQHALIEKIEDDFRHHDGILLTLHCDPIVSTDPEVQEMRQWLDSAIKDINTGLAIHDLRCAPTADGKKIASFICDRPMSFSMPDDELEQHISTLVAERYPNVTCAIYFDDSYLPAN